MKYLKIIIISLMFMLIISCSSFKQYDQNNYSEFLDSLYNQINNDKETYAAFDLRDKESYETLHIRQCQNFDYEKSSLEQFVTYLTDNYNKKTKIYIISPFDIDTTKIVESFDHVKILYDQYDHYVEYAESLFTMDKGEYDCGC